MSDGQGSWQEYAIMVLHELERLDACEQAHDVRIRHAEQEIARLKVKATLWGLIGGAIPVAIMIAVRFLLK